MGLWSGIIYKYEPSLTQELKVKINKCTYQINYTTENYVFRLTEKFKSFYEIQFQISRYQKYHKLDLEENEKNPCNLNNI